MGSTLANAEKSGNLTIEEEDIVRARLDEMEEAEEKEQGNDRAIEDKMKVPIYPHPSLYEVLRQCDHCISCDGRLIHL